MPQVAETGIKQRYYPMRGFGSFASAARFCSAFEEQRQYFRAVATSGARVGSRSAVAGSTKVG